jgi:MtN3 and saliva related transmembrane protein
MPEASTIVGYAASVASISAFVPQLYKVLKTRDTKSLSTPMWVFEVITFALWMTYGILLANVPIVVANAVCGVMAVIILAMKLGATSKTTSSRSTPCSRPA